MADIYIEYLPSIGDPHFDMAARRIVDLLRTYLTEHDTSLTTLEAAVYVNYVDRGDPAAYDFELAALTTDGTYRDLDLSSILPSGSKAVHISARFIDDAVGNIVAFRENGNSNTYNTLIGRTQVADIENYVDGIVSVDSSRKIEYYASNTTWTGIYIIVRGWFI